MLKRTTTDRLKRMQGSLNLMLSRTETGKKCQYNQKKKRRRQFFF